MKIPSRNFCQCLQNPPSEQKNSFTYGQFKEEIVKKNLGGTDRVADNPITVIDSNLRDAALELQFIFFFFF